MIAANKKRMLAAIIAFGEKVPGAYEGHFFQFWIHRTG